MKLAAAALFLVLIVLSVLYVLFMQRPKQYNQEITVGNTAVHIAIADDVSEQINGLSGVGKLCRDCGMLFVFPQAKLQRFWMHGMQFPLDFVFIRDSRIVELAENVQVKDGSGNVSQIHSLEEADMVLELPAGFVAKNNISIGSPLSGLGEGRVR